MLQYFKSGDHFGLGIEQYLLIFVQVFPLGAFYFMAIGFHQFRQWVFYPQIQYGCALINVLIQKIQCLLKSLMMGIIGVHGLV